MPKSNGRRSVNKTDGPKKKGKKAMTKSRRNDNKKVIEEGTRPYSDTEAFFLRISRFLRSV